MDIVPSPPRRGGERMTSDPQCESDSPQGEGGGRSALARPALVAGRRPVAPALADLAPEMAGPDFLLQEGRRAEALAIGFVQDFLDLEREAGRRRVHELEGAHRMAETEPAGGVDVLGRGDALFDEPDRLDDEGVEDAIDGETHHVLDADRRLAGGAAEPDGAFHRVLGSVAAGNDLDELHARDRREIMRPEKPPAPRRREAGGQR